MAFLNLSRDVLVFTDSSRIAGGIVGDTNALTATMVTSSTIKLFEEHYFSERRKATPQIRTLVKSLEGRSREVTSALEQFAKETTGLSAGSSSQKLSAIRSEEFDEDGTIELNGVKAWRPAGTLRSRTVGRHTLHFVVSPISMQGKVKAISTFGAAELTSIGPRLRASNSGCGACGACGACGLCVICAEINAGVAGAASAALIAVTALSAQVFDPKERLQLVLSGTPTVVDPKVRRLQETLNSLIEPSTSPSPHVVNVLSKS